MWEFGYTWDSRGRCEVSLTLSFPDLSDADIRAFPEKTESGGIPMRTRIGFKIRAGKEASMGWGSRIRRICGHA